jgi:hypothetical protein
MTVEAAHTLALGQLSLRVFPDRNWLVLAKHKNGQVNTVGLSGDDLVDAAALLNTAAAWLADYRDKESAE